LHSTATRASVGPRVVVGHDTRFSSADLTIGLVTGLRRAGCTVVDVGLVHRPGLDFSVDHFHADLGLYVTGGGRPEDWNGLDLVEPGGLTWSSGARLDELCERLRQRTVRPSRTIGPCRTVTILETYAAGLMQHFHALRPLRVAITCANPITAGLIQEFSNRIPCQLEVAPSSTPFGEAALPPPKLLYGLADMVHREHLDLGILIASDGRACHVLDECGELLATSEMLTLLAQTGETPAGNRQVVVTPPGCQLNESGLFSPLRSSTDTEEHLVTQLRTQPAWLATDDRGRYWHASASPACDAIVTLARVLQFFSLSDHAASSMLRR
jgi:phosphomannomutase